MNCFKCICGEHHDEITNEQIIAAELRKPLAAREQDPFPEISGNTTVNFGTDWHRGGVFLSDEAAARCATPADLNRAEVRAESETLRHVKAGLRSPGRPVPEWAKGTPPVEQAVVGRPRRTRKKETTPRRLTPEQRADRANNAARARAAKAAKRASKLAEML